MAVNPEVLNDLQAAIAAGAALGDPRSIPENHPPNLGVYAVVPSDYDVHSLEEFLPRPLRIRQKVQLDEAASFIDYVKEFGKSGISHIFFNAEKECFVAVLDYHEPLANGLPGWCAHVATFACRRSVEFATWLASNRHPMAQVEFARFLEENLPDVVEPNSAELLEVALTFQAQKEVNYGSGVRLSNGQIQFHYEEIVRGASSKKTVEVPESFVLGIPIHEGGPAYRIPVRLRWRLTEGKLNFWYEIPRPHRFIADALREIREKVKSDTGLRILAGVAK